MSINVIMPKITALPAELGGKVVNILAAETKYQITELDGGKKSIRGYDDTSLLSVAVCRKIVAAGGDVEDYPAWVEYTNPATLIPLTYPGALKEDGVTRHTFATWGTDPLGNGLTNNAPVTIAGKHYKAMALGAGKPILASQWPADTANIKVISDREFQAIRNA
jgi:hypothetical protein